MYSSFQRCVVSSIFVNTCKRTSVNIIKPCTVRQGKRSFCSVVLDHTPSSFQLPTEQTLNNESIETDKLIEKWMEPLILCTAAAKGDLAKVKYLIEDKKFSIAEADYDGRMPLHLAAEEGHLDVVKYLIDQGANINCEDRWGTTPLRGAISFNKNNVASLLREYGGVLQHSNKRLLLANSQSAILQEEKIFNVKNLLRELDGDSNGNYVSSKALTELLTESGLDRKRNKPLDEQLKAMEKGTDQIGFESISEQLFKHPFSLFSRFAERRLVIPNWKLFCKEVEAIFESCRDVKGGANASYIPELMDVDPNLWGLSIVSVDGQTFQLGNSDTEFSIQSCGKPLQYAIACEELGSEKIHAYVGQEPSGVAFNAFTLNSGKKPHNPLINSGAIIVSSLLRPDLKISKRFKYLTKKFSDLAGGDKIGFSQSVYLSEKGAAHRNFALAHFMKAEGGFPPDVDMLEAIDFYFQMCSCEVDCNVMANIAATFANNGRNPLSNQKLLSSPTVKRALQLMYSCGMYDFSGEWACTIGLPAKSGVSGCIYLVIPDMMGIAVYAPPLDDHGNSVRGVQFCKRFVDKFNWSVFDVLFSKSLQDMKEIPDHLPMIVT